MTKYRHICVGKGLGNDMKSKNDVEVLINGRKYTICGFESAEYLQKVATYINGKYMEFKNKEYFYSLDMDLRNILLAINIADDYFKTDRENKSYIKENERKDKMVLDMKHEVLENKSLLDKANEANEQLKKSLEDSEKKVVELQVKSDENSSKVAELEEKLSQTESKSSSHATKFEAEVEKVKKLEGENSRLKKKTETLNDKLKTQEGKNSELKSQNEVNMEELKEKSKQEIAELKKKYEAEGKKLKSGYETAKADLVKKYENAKSEMGKKSEKIGDELKEKYEAENAELKAKLEAAEKRISDLESRNRRGKR